MRPEFLPLWVVSQGGVDVAVVAAVDATSARRCCNVPDVHPAGTQVERIGVSRPGDDGVVRWLRDPSATTAVPDPRRVVQAAIVGGVMGAGLSPACIRSHSPPATRARWGAWLALSEHVNPSAIARACGFDHSTIYVALPKARVLYASGDRHVVGSCDAARVVVAGLLQRVHAQETSGVGRACAAHR